MKRFFIAFTLLFAVCLLPLSAQTAADKIVGLYHVVKDGRNSKVKIFKYGNGYRAQVVWLENMKNPDGTLRTDVKILMNLSERPLLTKLFWWIR